MDLNKWRFWIANYYKRTILIVQWQECCTIRAKPLCIECKIQEISPRKLFRYTFTWYPQVHGKKLTSSISNCSIHNGHYVIIQSNRTEIRADICLELPPTNARSTRKIISKFTSCHYLSIWSLHCDFRTPWSETGEVRNRKWDGIRAAGTRW